VLLRRASGGAPASIKVPGGQTPLCTYLSGVLLVGLVVNSALGWCWADPLVGLFIAVIALKEGREAWRGEHCCLPTSPGSGCETRSDYYLTRQHPFRMGVREGTEN
jgi:hypothetical protein